MFVVTAQARIPLVDENKHQNILSILLLHLLSMFKLHRG